MFILLQDAASSNMIGSANLNRWQCNFFIFYGFPLFHSYFTDCILYNLNELHFRVAFQIIFVFLFYPLKWILAFLTAPVMHSTENSKHVYGHWFGVFSAFKKSLPCPPSSSVLHIHSSRVRGQCVSSVRGQFEK